MATITRKASPLRSRLRAATRATILDAAEHSLAAGGLVGVRMEHLAARAGVSVGTLYNYFEDRDALLASLLSSRREQLLRRVDHALDEAPRGVEPRLVALVAAILAHAAEHRSLFETFAHTEGAALRARLDPPRGETTLDALRARARRLVGEGVAQGVLRRADAAALPDLLLAIVRASLNAAPGRRRGAVPEARRVVTFFLHGAGLHVDHATE